MADITKTVVYKIEADTKDAKKNLDSLDGSMNKLDVSADEAAASVNSVGASSQKAAGSFKVGGSEAGKLANVLKLVSPEAAEAARTIGDVAEASELMKGSALASSAVLGPLAVAVAAAGVVYVAYKAYIDDVRESLKLQIEQEEKVIAFWQNISNIEFDATEQLRLLTLTDEQRMREEAATKAAEAYKDERVKLNAELSKAVETQQKLAASGAAQSQQFDSLSAITRVTGELSEIQQEQAETEALLYAAAYGVKHYKSTEKAAKGAKTAIKELTPVAIQSAEDIAAAQKRAFGDMDPFSPFTDNSEGWTAMDDYALQIEEIGKKNDQVARDEKAATQAKTAASLDSLSQIGSATSDLFALMGAENKKFFIAEKAANIASVAMSTAAAVAKVWGQTGIFGLIAQAAPIAMGAVQIARIAAQQPPSYHIGGTVDGAGQVPATLQTGESVLTRAATARLGKDGVSALNSGSAVSQPMVVNMVYKHQVFDSFVQDNLKRNGALKRSISKNKITGQRG